MRLELTSLQLPQPVIPEISKIVYLQIEHWVEQLDAIAIELFYYESGCNQRQCVTYRMGKWATLCPVVDEQALVYKALLADSVYPSLQWVELPMLDQGERPDGMGEPLRVYGCRLGQPGRHAEYVVLLLKHALSPSQQQWLERQAQLLKAQLEIHCTVHHQRDKLQQLETAIHQTAHQLRNPMALIELYAETMLTQLPSAGMRSQLVQMQEMVGEMSVQIDHLLDYGQRSALQIGIHDLKAVLLNSLRHLTPWIQQKQIDVRLSALSVWAPIDPWQIRQVFDNLLNNAIHFSPVQGIIECSWQLFQNEVVVEICDRGPGLSDSDLAQVFTPFYSRRNGGTGLGLSIANTIILGHRGRCWAQNLPDGGAKFSFTLPV